MKRLMSNGTLRPQRPGKFDRIIAAISIAANIVQLNNAMNRPVQRKEFLIGGKIFSSEETRNKLDHVNSIIARRAKAEQRVEEIKKFYTRPTASLPLPKSIIKKA